MLLFFVDRLRHPVLLLGASLTLRLSTALLSHMTLGGVDY